MSGFFVHKREKERSNTSLKLAVIASLSLFFFATFGAILLLSSRDSDASSQDSMAEMDSDSENIPVLIPVQSINAGTALEPLMFRIEKRPRAKVGGTVLTSFEQLVGLYAQALIVPDQPLHAEYTTKARPINEVTSRIPDGFRGVTIRVDERSSIEGFARPGSRVDVTWVSSVVGKPAITTIVQNSLVISAGRNLNGDYPQGTPAPEEITLLVTKEDARRIILGQQTGILSLSLRGINDSGTGSSNSPITTDDLLGVQGGKTMTVRIIVVGIRDDDGIYDYFNWEDGRLIPTLDPGVFF